LSKFPRAALLRGRAALNREANIAKGDNQSKLNSNSHYTMKHILIAEDESALRNVLCDKFTHEGYGCYEADTAEKALLIAKAKKPDLILLDIIMQGSNGLNMLRELRQDDWGKDVPVIILTNLSGGDKTHLEAINSTSPAYFLVKADVEIAEIFEKAKSLL
jgi:DNA-binding response OmpR family regulator